MKVVQLAGYVAEQTAYHHGKICVSYSLVTTPYVPYYFTWYICVCACVGGLCIGEVSLHAAIIGMAQDYVGSNNVPFLVPSGQFGTRAQGGSDYASPRYIFTRYCSHCLHTYVVRLYIIAICTLHIYVKVVSRVPVAFPGRR